MVNDPKEKYECICESTAFTIKKNEVMCTACGRSYRVERNPSPIDFNAIKVQIQKVPEVGGRK
jgi:hypothetical protein